jgi:hypothetical protein
MPARMGLRTRSKVCRAFSRQRAEPAVCGQRLDLKGYIDLQFFLKGFYNPEPLEPAGKALTLH